MSIEEIAQNINEKAKDYKMRDFPQIRKRLHNLDRNPPSNIFTPNLTIFEEYAFHHGGRKELQFNIGFIEEKEKEYFRYGLGFSLQTSRTLPDFSILDNKFLRFSEFIKENKSKLSDYVLYYHEPEDDDRIFIQVDELDKKLFFEDNFIFLGKMCPPDQINYNEILTTFDELLDAYIYVEGQGELVEIDSTTEEEFKFEPKFSERVKKSLRQHPASKVEVDLRHNQIQGKIHYLLNEKFGDKHVGDENNTGFGKFIDLVVKNNSDLIFYEIKTSSSLRLCFREAIGQLIEYAYWSKKTKPTKLIVISENPITEKARKYLQTLRDDLHLNIYYQQYDFDRNKLSQEY